MDRTTLTRVLEACEGVTGKEDTYEAAEHLRLTFYLGGGGADAMVVSDVRSITNGPHFVKLVMREDGTVIFAEHGEVGAVSVRPPKGGARKPGFA